MRFLICIDEIFQEELDALANGLASNQQEVIGFNNNIYRSFDQHQPDYIVFSPATHPNPEVQKFLKEKQVNHMVLDTEKIYFSNGFELNLPSFANTIKYKPELRSKQFETDVLIVFDGKELDKVHDTYHKLYKNHRVKICGHVVNSAGYVGFGTSQDIVKLAKSAKVTVCSNKIILNSLIYNNILSVNDISNIDELLTTDAADAEKKILAQKKQLITENKLGKMILEKLSDFNK